MAHKHVFSSFVLITLRFEMHAALTPAGVTHTHILTVFPGLLEAAPGSLWPPQTRQASQDVAYVLLLWLLLLPLLLLLFPAHLPSAR